MKRKLSLIAAIVNTIATLAFVVMYGVVFWILASLFFDFGGKASVTPTIILLATLFLALIVLVCNIYIIPLSVKSIDKYAKRKISVIIVAIFNVALSGFVIYSATLIENILMFVLFIIYTVFLLAGACVYIIDIIRTCKKTEVISSTQTIAVENSEEK